MESAMKKRVIATMLTASMLAISVFSGGCGNSQLSSGDDGPKENFTGGYQADNNPEEAADAGAGEGAGAGTDTTSGTTSGTGEETGKTDIAGEETGKTGTAGENTDKTDTAGDETGKSDAQSGNASVPEKEYLLGSEEVTYYDSSIVPSVEPYTIAEDFSNVEVAERFLYTFGLDPQYENEGGVKLRKAIAKNGFAIDASFGESEFFDIYESNRYMQFPNFVTVDSLMHTYHLYFSHLMKTTEKEFLSSELEELGKAMLQKSVSQYEQLKGTAWEKAALRNVAFFYIGNYLMNDKVSSPINDSTLSEIFDNEIEKIMAAQGIDICEISGAYEDYSQYKPRGYYDGDELLEKYFRSMMWYGRIPFEIDDPESVKSAILISLAIDEAGKDRWESIYKITAFFAGASDDAGYPEFLPLITDAYGKVPEMSELEGSDDKLGAVIASLSKLPAPKINSIPVDDGDDPIIPSFRFMGQRFTIDAGIMQRLIYSAVGENGQGEKRFLPDTLDVAATLGSEKAMEIIEESGATEYKGYSDNMVLLKDIYTADDPALWNASLYAGWLGTLRPMFEKKGKGYPMFMQSDEWAKKNLETYAGSYAELKHDTILYAKQIMAEMGDGDDEEVLDDRGYVEPEPVVYSRFIFLSDSTRDGLKSYGMLTKEGEEDLNRLSEIGKRLLAISEKELKAESLTEDDYNFIREYGGDLEHFWHEAMKDTVDGLAYSYQAPCPVIADIATDPNGTVLEVGTGEAQTLYVVFPVDGKLHVGRGSAYSFYQFETPISDRLTDEEWRNRLNGGYLNDDWQWVELDNKPAQPEWTQSYRVKAD